MRKYEFVKQDGQMDCGVACLLMIIRHHQGGCSKEYLRNLTNTTKDGTRAYDLLKAGEKFHFTTFGLKGDLKDLKLEYLPVIAHVVKNNYYHFIVIYEIDFKKGLMLIADPSEKLKTISIEEFFKISTNYYLIFVANGKILKIHPKRKIQKLMLNFIKTHSSLIVVILLLSFFYTIASIFSSFYFQILLEKLNQNFNLSVFVLVALVFFSISFIRNLSKFLRMLLFSSVLSKFDLYLFKNSYHHLFSLPLFYYQNRAIGEVTSRIADLSSFRLTFGNFFFSFFIDFVLLFICLVLLFYLEIRLTIIVLILVVFEIFIFFLFKRRIRKQIVSIKEKYAIVMSRILDTLNHVLDIRFLKRESYLETKMVYEYNEFLEENVRYQKFHQTNDFFQNMIRSLSEIVVFLVGIILIEMGYITLSHFMSYYFLLSFFYEPINHFFSFCYDYMDSKESLSRIEEVYEVDHDVAGNAFPCEIEKIELKDVTFSYQKGNEVFKNWSGSFEKGDRILLYGKSGCGKSTLSRILSGFEDSYQGSIFVNGKIVPQTSNSSFRNHVCYVFQNTGLLNMSLRENILLGRDVDNEELKEVLKICQIFSISSRHVLGLDMMVEENGANLSGGECQRVVLARSLLTDSDVYIFDESLCNIDIKKEREILEGIFKYLKDKIVIVVSHRFYNEDLYNRKIHFLEGEVV